MELVPIIYTVLKIVAVLAIVTISISYFIYKIKQKRGTEEPALVRSIAGPENTVRKVVQRITRPLHQDHKAEQRIQHKVSPEKSEHKQDEVKIKREVKKQERKAHSTEKNIPQKERIAIVKNLKPQNQDNQNKYHAPTKEIKHKPTEDKKLNTLGDEIIDKYIDEDDKEFYTLNVNDKKNKK